MGIARHAHVRLFCSALLAAGCASRSPSAPPKSAAPQVSEPSSQAEHRGATIGADPAIGPEGNGIEPTRSAASIAADREPPNAAPPSASAAPVPVDLAIADEPIYFPGGRARPKGSAVEASLDDEIIATWNRGGLSSEPALGPKGKPAHTAPRVKVDVTGVRGDANEADLQRAARLKSYWPFRICYEQGLRRMQKLHGTIKLRLTLGPNGRPSGVERLATELKDPGVVDCVVKSAMGLGLPAPTSGAPQLTLEIELWPGDEPVSVKTAMRGKNAAPEDAAALTEALRKRWTDVRSCYAAGVGRHAGLWGRLGLALRITSGIVDEVSEVESRFPDSEVTDCVRKAFLHAEVPSTARELSVVYPLRLGRAPEARDAQRR